MGCTTSSPVSQQQPSAASKPAGHASPEQGLRSIRVAEKPIRLSVSPPFDSITPVASAGTNDSPAGEFTGGLLQLPSPRKKARGGAIGLGQQGGSHQLSFQLNAIADSTFAVELFDRFLVAVSQLSAETNLTHACETIVDQACLVLGCQRASLFFVDIETDQLELVVAKDAQVRSIRMPRGQGIAGHVATTGETVVLPDAHLDSRFDSSHDKKSGFRTKAVIACPVRDQSGEIVAVLMCLNKQVARPQGSNQTSENWTAEFSQLDRVLAENFASHTGLVLKNCQLFEESRAAQRKVETLLDIVQLLHSDPNTNSLIFTLTNRAHTLVDGDRSTLYLLHRPSSQLVVQQGNVDIRVPVTKGIAGHVARTGEVINIADCYADSRFDQSIDKRTGYRTHTMLTLPIFAKKSVKGGIDVGSLIGVLQVINRKVGEAPFNEADERMLCTLLELSGPLLAASSFFSVQAVTMSEADKARGGLPAPVGPISTLAVIPASTTGGTPEKTRSPRPQQMRRVTEVDFEDTVEDLRDQVKRLAELGEEEEEDAEEE